MAQKRKNNGELANSKKHKTKGKANLIFSAVLSPMVTINKVLVKLLGKKTLNFDDRVTVHFPEGILVDILSRLPVRSLVRLSKFWTTLISDPYFTRKHLNRAKNDQQSQKLLINRLCPKEEIVEVHCCPLSRVQRVGDEKKLKLDFPSILKPTYCVIYCCYDGLVVIHVFDRDRALFFPWNPTTRESIQLPALGFPVDRGS